MKNTKRTIGKVIPLVDLQLQYRKIKKDINQAIARVLKGGWYILGKEVENFEKELAYHLKVRYAVGVASGTDALTIALRALGLKKDDGVVLPANVYPSAFGVFLSRVRLQLADVDSKSLNISVDTLKKAVNRRTRAIVVVHLYGNPVDLRPIVKFVRERKLYLIEDCAQSIGAEYDGRKVGTFGDIACSSFYPTKNLGGYGDGGVILTNNESLSNKVKLFRMYGENERYHSILVGYNSRLDEIQAAILRVKLNYLEEWIKRRKELAKRYTEAFRDLPLQKIEVADNASSVYHLYVLMTNRRNHLANFLKENRITTGVHYPRPIHLVQSFKYLRYKKGQFPISEKASNEVLSIPIYPELTNSEQDYVIEKIREFFQKK